MKTAVLLCSMGGPDSLQAVRPFLFRLFNDPCIMRVPFFVRPLLALLISLMRASEAKKNYEAMGGASPLLANTCAQADALERALSDDGGVPCFVGMSYWHPFIGETMEEIKELAPDHLIVIPLYPQYSTTTTQSVKRDVQKEINRHRMTCRVSFLENFYDDPGFVQAMIENMVPLFKEAEKAGRPRVLFSAHGLPESIVKAGDPYPTQCEATVSALLNKWQGPDMDYVLCYQSRVGPIAWIGPDTEDEIKKAATEKRPILIVPIAFVCEHVETIVELDQTYRALAEAHGAPFYGVVPTVGTHPAFIEGMAQTVRKINQEPV